jgi:hypothetical protein
VRPADDEGAKHLHLSGDTKQRSHGSLATFSNSALPRPARNIRLICAARLVVNSICGGAQIRLFGRMPHAAINSPGTTGECSPALMSVCSK